MGRRARVRFVPLVDLLAASGNGNPTGLIVSGRVLVDGRVIQNPAARVRASASVRVRRERELRGTAKLRSAMDQSGVDPAGRVCLDLGAAAGGFTAALLEGGALKVYAVDVGHGQLAGWLRQDPRVVNLEGTNLAGLSRQLVPEPVGLVTVDLSYLALADGLPQLAGIEFCAGAELLALVKPTFELHHPVGVIDTAQVAAAVELAAAAAARAGWEVLGRIPSPVAGRRGTPEAFIHARREVR